MRNLGLLFIATLILAGAAAFLMWGPRQDLATIRDWLPSRVSDSTPTKKKELPSPPVKEEPKPARVAARPKAREANGNDVVVLPPPVLPPAEPAMPFPKADQIQTGTERARLLDAFGKPSMKTTAVDREKLLETYVYLNNERNTATFVLIQNGVVVSAHTSIY